MTLAFYQAGDETRAEPPTCTAAALLCITGFFLHLILSEPLLASWGMQYTAQEGPWVQKIHPGTLVILLAFFVLLWSRGDPIRQWVALLREQKAAMQLLLLYLAMLVYMLLRSGTSGLGLLIDVHITAMICALVLPYAPRWQCAVAVHLFIMLVALNSALGIAESLGRFHLFEFDPRWQMTHETYFRSTAWLGHPLTNAMITSVALFVMLGAYYPVWLKAPLALLFLSSLFAFGGRSGFAFTLLGLLVYGASEMKRVLTQTPSLFKSFCLAAAAWMLPACFCIGLYALLHSGVGERLFSNMRWDESADSRRLAFRVFDYMTGSQILLGVTSDQMLDIDYRMNMHMKLFSIENPWLLMCMYMGAILFPVWLVATLRFIAHLLRGQAMAIRLAVLAYFLIASTYNSFGCKSPMYLVMVSAVLCASRLTREVEERDMLPSPLRLRLS